MKNSLLILAVFASLIVTANAQFYSGNVALVRVGNGSETLANTGNSVFIDQYTAGGSYVNSVSIPNAGGPTSMIMNGLSLAGSDGGLKLSSDGTYLTIGGYNAAVGGSTVLNAVNGTTINRNVGRISAAGGFTVATNSTKYSGNATTAGALRTVIGDDDGDYWGVGTGVSGSTGLYYFGVNSPAAWVVSSGSPRFIDFGGDGNIYYTRGGSGPGLYSVPGHPTATATPTLFGVTLDANVQDFAFNSSMTSLYVANSVTGILRFDKVGASWVSSYTLDSGVGFNGLTVDWSGANPMLYATTADGKNLVGIMDTGAGSAATILATAGASQLFKGIDFAPIPEPTTVSLLGIGLLLFGSRSRRLRRS
jgi:hypothetical protein